MMELVEFIHLVDDLVDRLGPRLDPEQAELVRSHAAGGDWDEAVDLLVATLVVRHNPVTAAERAELARLLHHLGEPAARLDGLTIAGG